ncbi:MAG TPA: molybdopterin cofactor-binding domain-containing protein [Candidatus Sulfotelmatobacter sp.]|nr:molybdopterin cofactor-binding domain-containing protein [Candidatus Sulfotelmatobacter sp.]
MRRAAFLQLTTSMGAGLALGAMLPVALKPARALAAPATDAFSPNVWVHVRTDGTVKVMLSKSEMGQGVYTGLPMMVAEELDVPMDRIVVEMAPAEDAYADLLFTHDLTTGGSTSTPDMWPVLRQAGATARAMLVAAAAKQWGVSPASCTTANGVVTSGTHHATYAELAAIAATLPVPTNVPLKDPAQYTVIGTSPKRLDIDAKVRGTAQFGIDVVLPGMLYANIQKSPTFGGTVVSYDATAAKAVPGVVDVFPVSSGVAVVATNTWAAFQGAQKVKVTWKPGMTKSSKELFAEAEHLARTTTVVTDKRGAANLAVAPGKELGAVYKGPFLAHTPMEPMNTTVWVRPDGVEIWSPTQVQSRTKAIGMQITGMPADKVQVHCTFLGGGFGRRLHPDFVVDAVEVGKHMAGKPVKTMWRREDDVKNDAFRPMAVSVVRAKLDGGTVSGWEHRTAQKSIMRTWAPPLFKDGLDAFAVGSCTPEDYAFPNAATYYSDHPYEVPVGFMRAPGANWNCFVTESFMDELAHAAGADPLAFRLANLGPKATRARAVLQLAAEKANWGHPLAGTTQGLALGWWGGAYSAIVADVALNGSQVIVKRAVIAVDIGRVIHPDIALAQVQGALNYGLAMALTAKITLTNGVVDQNNFYDYTVLRMNQSPEIAVYIVPSTESPAGVGELGVPAIAPAIGNAIFRATGKRVRELPFSDALA